MLKSAGQGINIRDMQKFSAVNKAKTPVTTNIPLKQEPVKTSDIITIGATPLVETIVPFKGTYAGLQERQITKHLESYSLHDSKTGDNYTLKANNMGTIAIFEEEEGNITGQQLSVELKSSSISSVSGQSLLSPAPEEYYFFHR